jgi:pimeloyl-ACP methyl ester carboxylesterase
VLWSLLVCTVTFAASQPAQPDSGPGGKDYKYSSVSKKAYGVGVAQYWLFEPEPRPEAAPVIIFFHGWSAMNPQGYGAWIDHLVRRGNIVIYPVYQDSMRTPVKEFTKNALAALKDAFIELNSGSHVKPLADKCAVVGHSMGGLLAANYAALAAGSGLPQARAVMSVEPGKTWGNERSAFPLADLGKIPADTLLLAVAGDADSLVRDIDAKRIFYESKQVRTENKDFVIVRSDDHGQPALKASHMAPTAPEGSGVGRAVRSDADSEVNDGPLREIIRQRMRAMIKERHTGRSGSSGKNGDDSSFQGVDALDYFAFWKLFDGLYEAAFYDQNRNFALGGTSEQRYMGTWSDGVPVKELVVTDQP